MKLLFALAMIFKCGSVSAIECNSLQSSGDGVPAEYYIQECKGKQALLAGNGKVAEAHFRKALEVQIFEAPNYELKVELAEALCMQGRTDEALYQITEFQCMVGVDLSEIKCPLDAPVSKECAAMCEGFGSGLSEKGRALLLSKKEKATRILANCGRPNTSVERDAPKAARPSP